MIIWLTAKTNNKDLVIDYIEIITLDDKTISLNWDESNITRHDNGFTARYKGVYFGDEHANGRLKEIDDFIISRIGVYSEDETIDLTIETFEIEDSPNYVNLDISEIWVDGSELVRT